MTCSVYNFADAGICMHALWDFFERNDAKAETPVLWPPHEKS